tara:strand:+ start:2585 stop:3874 length:1290 start_codon:yes stop_codon:yes gene_type:complete
MKEKINNKFINALIIKCILFFLIIITFTYFYLNLKGGIDTSNYAFTELFINYQSGFIRRGLLGEIFWQLNKYFSVQPLIFFSYLFFIFYLIQIYLIFRIFKAYKNFYFISIIIFLSPALILFPIYEINLYFIKDILIKLSILLHGYIIIKYRNEKDNKKYIDNLKFILIPVLTVVMLVHEYQVLFLSVHFLLSVSLIKLKNELIKIQKLYLVFLIPIFLILIFIGDSAQYENLNLILKKFEIDSLHTQLSGGFYNAIGGFYKWHFYYFSYKDFVQLLLSLLLSVGIFFLIFNLLIKKKILEFNNKYQKNYIYFFIPSILCFLLALDHGRNISLISTHLVTFYAILILDEKKLNILKNEINKNFLKKCVLFSFIFFYIFMWRLDQMAGFGGREQINTIFQSSIFAEFIKFIKFLYSYIDLNIINLPAINL